MVERQTTGPIRPKRRADLSRSGELDPLRWVKFFGAMNAEDRGSHIVDVSDLLAGIFIADQERVVKYWPEWESLEQFAIESIGIKDPPWFYWLRFVDALMNPSDGVIGKPMKSSARVMEIYAMMHRLSNKATSKDVLYILATSRKFGFAKRLKNSGLNLDLIKHDLGKRRVL